MDLYPNISSPIRMQASGRSQTTIAGSTSECSAGRTGSQSSGAARHDDAQEDAQANAERAAVCHILECMKETTGFDSYEAYVDSLCQDPMYASRSYTEILEGCFDHAEHAGSGVDLIEVINESHGRARIDLRGKSLSASETTTILRNPTSDAAAQVILWPIGKQSPDNEDLIDVLGVGLQLEPCFFEPLRWSCLNEHARFRSKCILFLDSIGVSVYVAPKFVLSEKSLPVIVVAGPLHTSIEEFNYRFEDDKCGPNKAIYGLVQRAPLYDHFQCLGEPHLANVYIRTLSSLLDKRSNHALQTCDMPWACIIPWSQIEVAICKEDLDFLRQRFNEIKAPICLEWSLFKTKYLSKYGRECGGARGHDEVPTYLYRCQTDLRTWIEYFDTQDSALSGLLSHPLAPNSTKGSLYQHVIKERSSTAKQAKQLEAELRDFLQLRGNKSALEESRKSIEASNRQIDEGKRVKVFTVLAFLYVPLNLATSIFGMNVKQLNGTGVSIEAVLGTAVAALFLTVGSWLLFEARQSVRVWLRLLSDDDSMESHEDKTHVFFVRLYMIWWLSRNGFFIWMIRTNAGWCLLTKSSTGYRGARSRPGLDHGFPEDSRASEFVSYLILDKESFPGLVNPDSGGWFRGDSDSDLSLLS